MQYNKDTFNQWWEFLKLSKNYRFICELVSYFREDAQTFPLKKLLDEINKNIENIEKDMKLLAVYEKFGDVHHNHFEEWWKNYNQPKSVKTEIELAVYKKEKYRRLDMEDEQLKSYIKIWEQIMYFPNLYTPIQLYVNLNRSIKDINSDMRKFINKQKQNAGKSKREAIKERDEYLRVLDLFLQGYSIPQIIEQIGSKKEKDKERPEYVNVERSYNNKRSKAESILHNVEKGRFP